MHLKSLILFPNAKARDLYIREKYGLKTVDTTNLKTISEFFRKSRDLFLREYTIKNNITLINDYVSSIYMLKSIEEYRKNKKTAISRQEATYELSSNICALYKEITFSYFLIKDKTALESIDTLKEVLEIISIYKKTLSSLRLIDENEAYTSFINAITEKKIKKELFNYDYIEIHNLETIANIYSIFLHALEVSYGIEIKIAPPYPISFIEKTLSINNTYSTFNNFLEPPNLSNFAKCLITKENIKSYKDKLHFLSGFGTKQEIDNAVDVIISLIEKGENLHEIAIVFDDMEKYHDSIVERLQECRIDFDERRGTPLWKIPIIPLITSVFNIIDKVNEEIDVNAFIKLISSPYIKIEHIDIYTIRNILYDKHIFHLYEKMPKNIFISRFKSDFIKEEYKPIAKSILKAFSYIESLFESDTFPSITSRYIELIEFFNISENLENIEKNKNAYTKSNHALYHFLNIILSLSSNDMITDIKEYNAILNMTIRETYLKPKQKNEKSLTLANLYDIRGISFKHIFILGMNGRFLQKNPDSFILNNSLRENINKKYEANVFSTREISSGLSNSLFTNIISKVSNDTNIYFSFRYKDEDGNLEVPFAYLEEIFFSITEKVFDFKNLKEEGLIYRENYIPKDALVHTQKENMMSLFYYKKAKTELPKNMEEIIENVYKKHIKNKEDILNLKEVSLDICKYYLSKTMSVSELELLLSCPQSFIDSKFFKEEFIKAGVIGIKKTDKGTIYHDIFRLFFTAVKNKEGSAKLLKEKIPNYKKIALDVIKNVKSNTKYKIFDEKEIDINVLQEELENVMESFIVSEILLNKDTGFVPAMFEIDFDNHTIYKNENTSLRIKGRIDRIDLHYKKDDIIDGIRIVDYKAKTKEIKSSLEGDKILENYLQPILYLDYSLKTFIKNDIDICEVAFKCYDEISIKEENNFVSYSNKDTLLKLLNNQSKEEEATLKKYLSKVIEKMSEGIIEYFPSKDACLVCTKRLRCEYTLTED